MRELLGVGVAVADAQGRALESVCNTAGPQDLDAADKRNIVLNRKGSSQPAFFLKDADPLPREFDPGAFGQRGGQCSLEAPGWPAPRQDGGASTGLPEFDDGRGNLNSMDPYIGVQVGLRERVSERESERDR